MRGIERSAERDAALAALPAHVAEHGWTTAALRAALREIGAPEASAAWLFTGAADMIEASIDRADRRMQRDAPDPAPARLSLRIRGLVALRLDHAEAEREAVRRALALLSLPGNAAVASRSLARTVDAIWHAAADTSADFTWYTKRASLAAAYGATLLYWVNQGPGGDPGHLATLAFFDRRLAGLARIGRVAGRARGMVTARPAAAPPPAPV